jgi:hypothetical protein
MGVRENIVFVVVAGERAVGGLSWTGLGQENSGECFVKTSRLKIGTVTGGTGFSVEKDVVARKE